ncbi:MAG: MFS transporter [Chloroflexota bacterium]
MKLFKADIVNKDLFFTRFYYFMYVGFGGFVLPFMNLFYVSLGLNGKQVGTITSTNSIIGLLAAPMIVMEIKKRTKARFYLQAGLLIAALGYLVLSQQTSFFPIIILLVFLSPVNSSLAPLSDSMAVSVVQSSNSGYGSIRVLGSLGWIFVVPIAGWLIERMGFKSGFSGVSIGWAIAACLLFLISPRNFFHPEQVHEIKPGIKVSLSKILHNKTLVGFAIALIAIGFLNNGVQQFEYVFLSNLGASKQTISIAGILSAVIELPFMLLSDKIQKNIGPHKLMIMAVSILFFQRLTVLLFPSIAAIMIIRLINGISFSFYTISFLGLISSQTNSSDRGTILALFTVTLAGLVTFIASPISGAIYDLIGARYLYLFSSIGYFIAITSLWISRPSQNQITSR